VPGGKFEISEKIKDPTGSMEYYKFKEKKKNKELNVKLENC